MNYIDLVEKYCVVCKECDCVLFETDIIDGFLRYKTEGSQLNYFVLAL